MRYPNRITIQTRIDRAKTTPGWHATTRASTIGPLKIDRYGRSEGAAPGVAATRATNHAIGELLRAYKKA